MALTFPEILKLLIKFTLTYIPKQFSAFPLE